MELCKNKKVYRLKAIGQVYCRGLKVSYKNAFTGYKLWMQHDIQVISFNRWNERNWRGLIFLSAAKINANRWKKIRKGYSSGYTQASSKMNVMKTSTVNFIWKRSTLLVLYCYCLLRREHGNFSFGPIL